MPLLVVENTMPLHAWSIFFITFGLLTLVGLIIRRHFLVWLGHSVLALLHGSLAIGIFIQVAQIPYWDGIRVGSVLMLPTTFHLVMATRMGPRPLMGDNIVPVEVTGAADAS